MSFFSPSAILDHLMEYIPRLSDRFSNNALVSAAIIAGTPQTLRVTDNLHGLSAGGEVVLIGGKTNNPITAVSLIVDPIGGDVLRFTTNKDHNLTLNYTLTVDLSGFTNPIFNGTFTVISVPSRNLFEISGSTLPVLNGNEVLVEEWEVGINGLFFIDSIVDVNTYDILLTGKPEFEPQTVPILKRSSIFKMSIAIDAERARSLYTPQPNDKSVLWLFVIMGDASASKDRKVLSDANQTNTAGQGDRTLMINTFSVLVFFPTSTETAGALASDLAWNEIYKVLLAVGAGIKFDDFGTSPYRTSLIDHGTAIYTNAFYAHAYTFEYCYQVTQEEQFLTQFIESVPFRDNAISSNEEDEGSNIDLDEEPT